MHITRELCAGQICVTPNAASFAAPGAREWLEKFYTLNDGWQAEDRRKLLAFVRDLLNSDYAGHRLTFVQFTQAPPLQSSERGLQRYLLFRPARIRQECRRALRSGHCLEQSECWRPVSDHRSRVVIGRDCLIERRPAGGYRIEDRG